jgi:hypothetical protein
MTPTELYNILDNNGVEYEIVENFEGLRTINFEVEEESDDQD